MTVNTGLTIKELEHFLMILVRITSFFYMAPFFSMSSTPNRVKVGLGVFISILVFQTMNIDFPRYNNLYEYTLLILKESAIGLLVGFSAYISNTIIMFAGRMIDMEIGLSMATVFDYNTRTQASISGALYNNLILILLIVTDMHHFLLKALVDTFKLIPIGGIKAGSQLYETIIGFLSQYIIIGFRIILPIFAVTLIVNVILALLAKVAPQMNMFVVGIQLKLLVGLSVMFLLIGILPSMSDLVFEEMRRMVIAVIKGMY